MLWFFGLLIIICVCVCVCVLFQSEPGKGVYPFWSSSFFYWRTGKRLQCYFHSTTVEPSLDVFYFLIQKRYSVPSRCLYPSFLELAVNEWLFVLLLWTSELMTFQLTAYPCRSGFVGRAMWMPSWLQKVFLFHVNSNKKLPILIWPNKNNGNNWRLFFQFIADYTECQVITTLKCTGPRLFLVFDRKSAHHFKFEQSLQVPFM